MLAVLLLAGVLAAPVSSAALFVPVPRPARTAGRWPAVRRFLLALLGTERWRRRVTPATPTPPVGERPFVSLHVPAHNEPPDMVIATLESLLRLDYPRYQVVAIDDNTDDEALWRPVERWCAANGVTF